MKAITKEQAEQYGLTPLTTGYILPREADLMVNVLKDMERGKIRYEIVDARIKVNEKITGGFEVWRAGMKKVQHA